MIPNIQITAEFWQEGPTFVAYVAQLDISSCGNSLEQAKKNVREAVEAYLEEAHSLGTLQQILEEAGYSNENEWRAPEIISIEKMRIE